MAEFERDELAVSTPCEGMDRDRLVSALAHTHGELVIIHPFREGNGRCARLLAWLMALQAGLPPLDFAPLAGRGKRGLLRGQPGGIGPGLWALAGVLRGRYPADACGLTRSRARRRRGAVVALGEGLADALDRGGTGRGDLQCNPPDLRVAQEGVRGEEGLRHRCVLVAGGSGIGPVDYRIRG